MLHATARALKYCGVAGSWSVVVVCAAYVEALATASRGRDLARQHPIFRKPLSPSNTTSVQFTAD